MASPNIDLMGAVYPTVSGVTLPKQGGGTATFPWVEGSRTITQNNTYDVSSLAEVVVNVSGGGGGTASTKAVNFRDYDGSLVCSYTAEEFAALTAMPANPDHSGDAIPLTAQGWNWSLANAQSYVAKYGKLEVGQMYKTTDGKTHVLIHLDEGRTSPMLGCCPNGTVIVDWGDGTATDTLTGTSVTSVKWTPTHNYSDPGDYHITLTCTGSMSLYGVSNANQASGLLRYSSSNDTRNRVYQNAVKTVRCADTVTRIGDAALYNCGSLTSINIPDTVTSVGSNAFYNCYSLTSVAITDGVTSIGGSAFQNCFSLTSVTIPDTVTSVGNYAFYTCYSLTSVNIPDGVTSVGSNAFYGCYGITSINIPDTVTSIGGNAFYNCFSLTSVNIPDAVTSIGNAAFQNCYSLTSVTIPDGVTGISASAFYGCYSLTSINIPDTVTSIGGNAFQNCYSLTSITIPSGVTSIGASAFYNCYNLKSINIPDGVTSIGGSAFNGCYSLTSVNIPSRLTSVGANMFQNCYSLTSITIPSGVTSIGASAFYSCSGISEYHILPTTPPSIANANAFTGIVADCIMYVPEGCLEAYQTATNWSTYSGRMQEESA